MTLNRPAQVAEYASWIQREHCGLSPFAGFNEVVQTEHRYGPFMRNECDRYCTDRRASESGLPFSQSADGQQFTEAFIQREAGRYESDDVSPGVEREGWIAYEVPAELGPEDVEIDYTSDDFEGEWSARWVTDGEE